MSRGHVKGTKKEPRGSQDWYAAIEAATLRQFAAAAAQSTPTPPQEDAHGLADELSR